MLILFQSLESLRESFPFLPLALVGVGILAMLWLLRHSKKKGKAKPASLSRLEDRHSAAMNEIGSIKMNLWMDKHVSALVIPRRKAPTSTETLNTLKEITAFQNQALTRAKANHDKTPGKGVS